MPSMPRVTISAGIAPLVMRKPLKAPVAAPAAKQPRMPTHQGRPRLEVSSAPTTPARPRIDPTDRSIPAEQMTNVCPIADTPNTEVDNRMLRRLEPERKTFDRRAIAAQRTASTISDSSLTAPPPAKRARHEARAAGVPETITTLLEPRGAARSANKPARSSDAKAHLTYCSNGSLFASRTCLVRTRVGT